MKFCVGMNRKRNRVEQWEREKVLQASLRNAARMKMRLVLTSLGYISMAYRDVEKGDRICHLDGCKALVVLRPRVQGGFYLVCDMSYDCFASESTERKINTAAWPERDLKRLITF
jgi:hypothetical protein